MQKKGGHYDAAAVERGLSKIWRSQLELALYRTYLASFLDQGSYFCANVIRSEMEG